MITFTLSQAALTFTLGLQLMLVVAIPRTPFSWHRRLGFLAMSVGVVACSFQLAVAGVSAWTGEWRQAAEHLLISYVVVAASWLAWKASRPF